MSTSPKLQGILALTQELVRIPSQAEHDTIAGMLAEIDQWLTANDVPFRTLQTASGQAVGLLITLHGAAPGPVLCLDACLDTAPVGDRSAWTAEPFGAEIRGGRLYGRGAADSKVAVSIFAHLARELLRHGSWQAGTLHILFDGDEHTGGFGGVRAFIEGLGARPTFAAIGYPGNQRVVCGARGFFRGVVRTYGTEAHSGGSRTDTSQNAVVKMARLVDRLSQLALPHDEEPDFPAGPRLTVTAVRGGSGFSQIPGRCEANLDLRLTHLRDKAWARNLVLATLAQLDLDYPTRAKTSLEELESWPAYVLKPGDPAVGALQRAAEEVLGRPVPTAIAGPSNIGNFLARYGIPATCGFGVTYGNLHGADEWVEIDSIAPIYSIYRQAVLSWARVLEPELALAG